MALIRLQLWRTYGVKIMEKFFRLIKITLPLAIVSIYLLGYVLHYENSIFREFQIALLSVEWMLLVCLAVWCGSFIFLKFSLKDLPLIGLLLIAISVYFIGYTPPARAADAIILLAGVTMGRGTQFLLKADGRSKMEDGKRTVGDEVTSLISKTGNQKSGNQLETPYVVSYFLIGLILLLAFGSWWHLDAASSFYHGPRWMGLWDNPNIYGMLMGAGGVLAAGLLAARSQKSEVRSQKSEVRIKKIRKRKTKSGKKVNPQIAPMDADCFHFFICENLRNLRKIICPARLAGTLAPPRKSGTRGACPSELFFLYQSS